MSRRYVYWRQGDGKPSGRADDKHALTTVLAEIGKVATPVEDRVQFKGLQFHRFSTILKAAVVILEEDDEELNDADSWAITMSAIKAAVLQNGGRCPIACKDFLAHADRAAAAFFRKPSEQYLLVSMLSVESLPARKIPLNALRKLTKEMEIVFIRGGHYLPSRSALYSTQRSRAPLTIFW